MCGGEGGGGGGGGHAAPTLAQNICTCETEAMQQLLKSDTEKLTSLSEEAVARRLGAAGQKLMEQVGLSWAARRNRGKLPAPVRASKQATTPSSDATRNCVGCARLHAAHSASALSFHLGTAAPGDLTSACKKASRSLFRNACTEAMSMWLLSLRVYGAAILMRLHAAHSASALNFHLGTAAPGDLTSACNKARRSCFDYACREAQSVFLRVYGAPILMRLHAAHSASAPKGRGGEGRGGEGRGGEGRGGEAREAAPGDLTSAATRQADVSPCMHAEAPCRCGYWLSECMALQV